MDLRKGFTALEVVIVSGLSLLLLTALLRFLVAGYPIARITLLQSDSNEAARIWLKRIAREIRQLRDSDTGAYPLVTVADQELVFYANIDSDAATERVRYMLSGTDLIRGVLEPTGVPLVYDDMNEVTTTVARTIRNGANPVFTYYGGDYPDDTTELTGADITDIKYVEFRLVVDADEAVQPVATDVVSQVQLRNLKTNLGETTDD